MRKVCAPAKSKDVALEDIEKVSNYLKPKVNKIVLRARFRERKEKEEETVTLYVAALRSMAAECEFADEEEVIKDQVLSGIRSKAIKIALFKVDNLTLDAAMKTAVAIKEANKAAEKFEANIPDGNKDVEADSEVYRVRTWNQNKRGDRRNTRQQARGQRVPNFGPTQGSTGTTCTCCGKKNHQKKDCWHRMKNCDGCGRQGHLRAICRERDRNKQGRR